MKKIVQIMMIMFLMHGSIKLIAGTYSGGTGTEIDPYQIATAHDLIELSLTPADWGSDISAIYFIQTADIVFNSDHTQQDWNNNGSAGPAEGFSPIGNNDTPFQGTYDGQNYTISNLYISRSSRNDVGLFGYIDNSGSGVKNLGLISVNITGSYPVGGLAGSLQYQNTINNCYSTGNVSGTGNVGGLVGASFNWCTVSNSYSTCSVSVSGIYGTAGGLVGDNGSGTISNSHATGNVSGTTYLGGFAGENDGTVINSYSTGGVSGSSDFSCIGGLVGYNSRTISSSYSTGNVSGINYVGGLVGYNNRCTISNSYSLGNVTRSSGANTFFGGFSGYDIDLCTIEYCYSKGKVYESTGTIWASGQKGFVGESDVSAGSNTYTNNFFDSEVSEQTSGTGATAKTSAQMKTKTTFTDVNWDFVGESTNGGSDFWNIFSNINDGYPILSWQYYYPPVVTTQAVSDVAPETATGNGNISDLGYPYPVQHGVCWNTSGSPTIADFKTEEGTVSEVGAFTSNITGLSPFTHYYVRAYATNSEGTSYGDQTDFSTPGIPVLTTNEIEGISVNSAISGGNVTNGDPVSEYGVCWSTSPNPTITDAHTVDGTGLGAFESSITGLSKNTHYYLRAYATNSIGTGYGEEKDFITPNQLYNMLDFDGANDYVSAPITLPDQGTIEFWFKADDINTGYLWTTTADHWYAHLSNGTFYTWIGGSAGGEALTKSLLTTNTWYHCAITWQKAVYSVSVQLYINGTLSDATAIPNSWGEPGSVLTLGKKTTYFNGKLDEFRIWNTVKTESEIRENMHKFISPSSNNLMCYCNFDNSSGSTATDGTSGGYNGTLFNMTNTNWLTSTAPIGVYGTSVRSTDQTSAGASGKTISATITSGGDDTNCLGIYTYGDGDASINVETFPEGITQRTNFIWGVKEFGSCTSDLVFDYSGIAGTSTNESALKLIRRSDAASAWSDITATASQNTTNHTYTLSGITSFSEFSISDNGENPLPVELVSFTANQADGKVTITWQTATEVNNYGFEVERTSPRPSPYQGEGGEAGRGWEKIGFVQGHGNSNSPKNYSFEDKSVESGKYSYRLKQIDNDGGFRYSQEVEVKVEAIPTEFTLFQNYPNPFNPTTTIKYSIPKIINNQSSIINLKVYDILGSEVATLVNEQKKPGFYSVEWNASNIASGIYFYRITADNFVQTKKLLLLK